MNRRTMSVAIAFFVLSSTAHAESWGLLLKKGGNGEGRVCVTFDGREDCEVDDAGNETSVYLDEFVYLRATPEPGSRFVEWSEGCHSKTPTCKWLTKKPINQGPLVATAVFARGPARPKKTSAAPTPATALKPTAKTPAPQSTPKSKKTATKSSKPAAKKKTAHATSSGQ